MFRTIVFSIFFAVIGMASIKAQPYHEPTYEQLLNTAEEHYEMHFYYNAIELYRDCYDISRDVSLIYRIAELEYLLRDYKRAQRYYERIVRATEPKNLLDYNALYLYARTERALGDYNKAYNIYDSFLTLSSNDSLKTLAQSDIDGMIAASGYEQRYDLYVTPLEAPVNTPFSEYSPQESVDGNLYWTSFGRSTVIRFDKEGSTSSGKSEDEDWYAHIVRSNKDKDGEWDTPRKLNETLNRPLVHTTNNSITPDGNYMYFNQQIISGQEVVKSIIMVSKKNGNYWGAPQEIENLNGDWLSMYPTYGELFGQEVMFFVSDMPGSLGGLDIYYAPKKGEFSFGDPVNLGRKVNSIGDERTPYYVDGKLYFSSDGHPGMGGLDIFYSEWDGKEWSEPENMGLGYNSRYDDFYFITDAQEEKGYLVSNRPNQKMRSLRSETCCDDIYQVGIREIELDVLTTVFSDHKPLVDATVEVVETVDGKLTDNVSSLRSPKGNTYRFPLQADKTYRIYAYKEEYTRDSTELSTMDVIHSYTFKKQFDLARTEPEMKIITINEPIRLNNIYYAFDQANILPESKASLNEIYNLMTEYDNMVIELSAHTDSRGDNDYNLDLSQRRAESAKNYLVEKGIPTRRIIAKGYGETQILNGCVDGVECTEEQHQFNRRTEFKIVEGPRSIEVKKEVLEGKKEKDSKGVRGKLNIKKDKSQGFVPDKKPASLYFHNPFYDFGVITSSDKEVKTQFTFTNVGEEALEIDIATGSNCTIQWPQDPIAPGESGTIFVTFNCAEIMGEREVNINVIANTIPSISEARFRAFVSP